MKQLSPSNIREIHDYLLEKYGGLVGEHSPGLIDFMAEKPFQIVFGLELYPSIFEKAAAYFHGFAERQLFVDANKRTAYGCLLAFLRLNNYKLPVHTDILYDLAIKVAIKEMEIPELAEWIEQRVVDVGDPE